jgi:hypothetical protein
MHRFRWSACFVAVAVAVVALTGCSRRVLDFTVISSKNVSMKVDQQGIGPRTEGVDHVWWLLTIPLGTPQLKQAVDRAIENAGPQYDALIDGVIYSEAYYYLITGKSGFKVVGTPINTKQLVADLQSRGVDVENAMANVLYHSSTGRDNASALERTPVVNLASVEERGD